VVIDRNPVDPSTFLQTATADHQRDDEDFDFDYEIDSVPMGECALQRQMQGSVHSNSSPWSQHDSLPGFHKYTADDAVQAAALPNTCKIPATSRPTDSRKPKAPREVPFAAVLLSPILSKPSSGPPAATSPNSEEAAQDPASAPATAAFTTVFSCEGLTPFSPDDTTSPATASVVVTPTARTPATSSCRKAHSLRVKPAITKKHKNKKKNKANQQITGAPNTVIHKQQLQLASAAAGLPKMLPAIRSAGNNAAPVKHTAAGGTLRSAKRAQKQLEVVRAAAVQCAAVARESSSRGSVWDRLEGGRGRWL
jgi:hypothetical protein